MNVIGVTQGLLLPTTLFYKAQLSNHINQHVTIFQMHNISFGK